MHVGNADERTERRADRLAIDRRLDARDLRERDVARCARAVDFFGRDRRCSLSFMTRANCVARDRPALRAPSARLARRRHPTRPGRYLPRQSDRARVRHDALCPAARCDANRARRDDSADGRRNRSVLASVGSGSLDCFYGLRLIRRGGIRLSSADCFQAASRPPVAITATTRTIDPILRITMNPRLPAKVQRNEGVPYARHGSRETGRGETHLCFCGSNSSSKSRPVARHRPGVTN